MSHWVLLLCITLPYGAGIVTGLLIGYDRGKSNGYKDAIRRLGAAQRASNRYVQ